MEITLTNDVVNIKTCKLIKLHEYFTITTKEGPIDLRVDTVADLDGISEEYHESVFNMLTSKYLNKLSFGDNPFSQCKPPKIKKWYQFWKK